MENQEFRKSVFGGFHKQDVLAYIDRMNESTRQNQQTLQKQLDELTAARDGLQDKVSAFEQSIEALERQMEETRARAEKAEADKKNLQAQLNQKNQQIIEKESMLYTAARQKDNLQKQLDELQRRDEHYQEMCRDLGAIIVEARTNARTVLEGAKTQGETLSQSVLESVGALARQMGDFRREVLAIKNNIHETVAEMDKRLDAISDAIAQTAESLELKKEEGQKEISRLLESVPSAQQPPEPIAGKQTPPAEFFRSAADQQGASQALA